MPTWRILEGDVRTRLAELPADSIHTVVTSPPYFGLRDYDTAPQVWGGTDPACPHEWQKRRYYVEGGGGAGSSGEAFHEPGPENAERIRKARWREDEVCTKCGAWSGHLGLEPSPSMYVQHLVEIFRAVRRVLRPDGTCWLNLGDSFCSNGGARTYTGLRAERGDEPPRPEHVYPDKHARWRKDWGGIKTKDLIGVPWRVAFALQDDGWWLRSDIVWKKLNPMPESIEDRPTRAHEFIFLLAKSERYFFDRHAVLEPLQSNKSDLLKVIQRKSRIGGKHKATDDPLLKSSSATNIGQKRSVGDAEAAAARLAEMQPVNPTAELFADATEPAPAEPRENGEVPRKQYRHEGDVRVGREAIANPNRMWDDPEALERMLQGRNIRDVWETSEPLVRLRSDLSEADRSYVLAELTKRGL